MGRIVSLLISLMLFIPAGLHGQSANGSAAPEDFPYGVYEGMTIKDVHIQFKDCTWCGSTIENLAIDLINLHKEEPFTEKTYRQSLDALKLSKRFEEISPSIERFEEGIIITLLLKPYWEIVDIQTEGEYPLFTSEVLRSMSIYPGDAYLPKAIGEQEALVTSRYKKEGYIRPEAHITSREDPQNGTVVLTMHIKPGDYHVLDSLHIKGNNAIFTNEIKSRMNVWRNSFLYREARRFRETELQQDVKNLKSLYWQKGYTDCEILYSVNKNEQTGRVKVGLSISEGPLYEISIRGNKYFWAYTLKKDVVIFDEGNRRDRGLRKSISNMKQRYRMAGFLFTEIVPVEEKITQKDKTSRKIELNITEGPRSLVKSVKFTGNRNIDDVKLKDVMKTGTASLLGKKIFVPEIMDQDIAAIQSLYQKEGYTDAKAAYDVSWSDDKASADVVIKINEGVKAVVSSIQFDGLTVISDKNARSLIGLKEGKPFNPDSLKTSEIALTDTISDKGHPYVTEKTETVFNADRTEAAVTFHIDEGPSVSMGNIYYRGNFLTKKRIIDRELGIKTGDRFSLKTVLNGQKEIRDMNVFNSVQFRTFGLKEKKQSVTMLVDMDEIKPYYYQAGAGYISDRGLYTNARIGDRNLFGLNKEAGIGGEISQIGYNSQVDITQRRLFGTSISTTYALSYEKKEEFNQDFGTSVWTSSLVFSDEFKPKHLKTSLGVRYERRDEFPTDNNPSEADTYAARSILVTTPFISYDTRDSFVKPKEGVFTSLSIDISKGLKNSYDNFLKYNYNLRYFYSPLSDLTLAWLGRVGFIDPFGRVSNIPEDQLFYLGGTLSVRGFDENMLRYDSEDDPVGGRLSLVGSMEVRYNFTGNWEASVFYDTGAVKKALVDEGSDKFRSSVGIGIRYITPIGPMGLMYGYKLNRESGESSGRLHFSIGYTF